MRFAVITATLLIASSIAAVPALTIKPITKLRGTAPSDVVCEVRAGDEEIRAGSLTFVTPGNFGVDTQTFTFQGIPSKQAITRIAHLKANDAKQPSGSQKDLIVELSATTTSASPSLAGSATAKFDYENGCQSVASYLLYGTLGALIGYLIRLLVAYQQGATPPQVVVALGETPSTVDKNHYWLDGGLTLLLSFIVLVYLINGGRPPEVACTWYGSIVAGVALGFLSNAQLMSKLPIPTRALAALRSMRAENLAMRAENDAMRSETTVMRAEFERRMQ